MKSLEDFLALPDVTEITEEVLVSQRLGKFKVRAMSQTEFGEYQRRARMKINNKGEVDFDTAKFQLMIVAGQTIEPNFNNAELLKKANCVTAIDFIQKKLLVGEIAELAAQIQRVSGFDRDINEDIEEAKN